MYDQETNHAILLICLAVASLIAVIGVDMICTHYPEKK